MDYRALTTGAQRQLSSSSSSMFYHRFLRHAEAVHVMVVLLGTLFCIAMCKSCSMNGMLNPVEYDESYRENFDLGFQDAFVGGEDTPENIVSGNSVPQLSLGNVCTNLNSFCFPSTLPGFFSEQRKVDLTVQEVSGVQFDATLLSGSTQERNNLSWSSNCGIFKLLNGRVVSCSMDFKEDSNSKSCCRTCGGPLLDQKFSSLNPHVNFEDMKLGVLDGFSSLNVEITPPLLDWGQKSLYFPSLAFLTVTNTHTHGNLNVYVPYSTNSQFYPCNFSEITLGPGEVASVCFVFLPTCLGVSSGDLVLQTSSGGFFIQARGLAVESPYGIRPLVDLDVSSSGRWSESLSLFNPFDETLYVEEVTAWISFSSGITSHPTKAICSLNSKDGSADLILLNINEWLNVKSGQVGLPVVAIRPHRHWEVRPHSTETIIELDFPYHSQGKIFGAFCMHLLRSSKNKVDTVMVPLQAEVGGKSGYDDLTGHVSVSLEPLVPCRASGIVVLALSLRNAASYLVTVGKISGIGESSELFQIKYMEGLILFPGTVTQVAVVTYTPVATHDHPSAIPNSDASCKFLILTNDSTIPQIEIPCKDIVSICSRHQLDSYVRYEHRYEKVDGSNARTGSVDNGMQLPSEIQALETEEADELVLGNWRSQGTASEMSVLDDHEVMFSMVQVGTRHSKWITVNNPSHQPVVMQLILNSGEIIDECRDLDDISLLSSSSSLAYTKYTTSTRHGFSIAEDALTEAYVHPYGRVSFGPILFHPSSRCGWKSSALIRNNLSGVEWLSLRGFGGLVSLVLLEGSKPLQTIEYKLNLPSPLNFSTPDVLYNEEDKTHACSQPFSKELYAKNTGDLPLEISRIEVSGAECELDGFVVHTCKGFSLEPGESMKLTISYQTDFSAALVQRDLELALPTGILVIPMRASLPLSMLNFCKSSKRSSVAILLVASIMFLVFCCILPQLMAFGTNDHSLKSGKSSYATVSCEEKPYRAESQKNNNKFIMSTKLNGYLRSVGEEETLMLEAVGRYSEGKGVASKQKNPQPVNAPLSYQGQAKCVTIKQKGRARPSSLLSKSLFVESSDLGEAPQPENLSVETGKVKGRRRKKKKGSSAGLFDVSSSQSGNSTPSPPLSPVASLAPKRSWPLSPDADQFVEARNPFTQVADRQFEKSSGTEPAFKSNLMEPPVKYGTGTGTGTGTSSLSSPVQGKPSAPRQTVVKPVMLQPSATFPCIGRPAPNLMCSSPFLAPTSTVAPHARAPGSEVYDRKTIKADSTEEGHVDEFKYDIWGKHLFGLHLIGSSKDVSVMPSLATETNCNSFFTRDPQTLVTNCQSKSVSPRQEG